MAPDLVALPIERIVHETMSQRVYRDLRELIMSGRVQPGQRLRYVRDQIDLPPVKVMLLSIIVMVDD